MNGQNPDDEQRGTAVLPIAFLFMAALILACIMLSWWLLNVAGTVLR